MKRKWIALALAVLSAVALLTGCADQTPASPDTTTAAASTTAATATTASATTSSAVTASEPAQTGKELSFSALTIEHYDPSVTSDKLLVHQELEKKSGVTIKWETAPTGEYETIVQTRLAAGIDLPDVISWVPISDNNFLFNLAKQGVILELTDIIPQWPNLYKALYVDYPDAARSVTSPEDGKIYWLPWAVYNCDMQDFMFLYREDWLSKLGLDIPNTVDSVVEYLKLCQQNDMNGNGKVDEYLTPKYAGVDDMITLFGPAFGVKSSSLSYAADQDGIVSNALIQDSARELLAFLNNLYTSELLDPDAFSIDTDIYNNKVASNGVSALCREPYSCAVVNQVMWETGGLDQSCRFAPVYDFIYGKDGLHGVYRSNVLSLNKLLVTSDENLEAVMTYLDFCASEEGQTIDKYGVEGLHWQRAADGSIDISIKEKTAASQGFTGTAQTGIGTSYIFKVEVWDPDAYWTLRSGLVPYGYDHEAIKKAWYTMSEDKSVIYYPFTYGMTTESEAAGLSEYSELSTYMSDCRDKFISGAMSFDEWDAFVENCNELGLKEATALYQKLYDRYMSN